MAHSGKVLYTMIMTSMHLSYLCTNKLNPGIQTFELDKSPLCYMYVYNHYPSQHKELSTLSYLDEHIHYLL